MAEKSQSMRPHNPSLFFHSTEIRQKTSSAVQLFFACGTVKITACCAVSNRHSWITVSPTLTFFGALSIPNTEISAVFHHGLKPSLSTVLTIFTAAAPTWQE